MCRKFFSFPDFRHLDFAYSFRELIAYSLETKGRGARFISKSANETICHLILARGEGGGGKRNNSGTYHVLVNLIGYNGYVITSGDVENVKYMVATEHRAARIRRIVHNNRRG